MDLQQSCLCVHALQTIPLPFWLQVTRLCDLFSFCLFWTFSPCFLHLIPSSVYVCACVCFSSFSSLASPVRFLFWFNHWLLDIFTAEVRNLLDVIYEEGWDFLEVLSRGRFKQKTSSFFPPLPQSPRATCLSSRFWFFSCLCYSWWGNKKWMISLGWTLKRQ